MFSKSVKQIMIGAIATFSLAIQISSPVFAATNEEAIAAAQKGVEYLAANQSTDGSITGFGGETEWSVVALQASGQDPASFKQPTGASATEFLQNNQLPDTAPATDIERKILAIAAAHQDPTTFGGTNHIDRLADKHVSDQIGDPTLLNDDIFGVIAIDASQSETLRDMAQDGLDYFLAHQQTDGGFSYTTTVCAFCGTDSNDTAAAIIAMYSAENMGLSSANLTTGKDKALVYLLGTQKEDGGFGYDTFSPSDGSSTAWALMALNVIGSSVQTQAQAARDWLLANQNADGGFSYGAFGFVDSSTSITAHALVAILGSSWLLRPEPVKPVITTSTAQPPVTPPVQTTQPTPVQIASAPTSPTIAPTTIDDQPAESPITPQTAPQTKAVQTTTPPKKKCKKTSQPRQPQLCNHWLAHLRWNSSWLVRATI